MGLGSSKLTKDITYHLLRDAIPVYKINKNNVCQKRSITITKEGDSFYLKYGQHAKQKHRLYAGCAVEEAGTENKKLQLQIAKLQLRIRKQLRAAPITRNCKALLEKRQLVGYKLIVIRDKKHPTETRPMKLGNIDKEGWPFICRITDVEKIEKAIKRVQIEVRKAFLARRKSDTNLLQDMITAYKLNKRNMLQLRFITVTKEGDNFYFKYGMSPKQKHQLYADCAVEDASTDNAKLKRQIKKIQDKMTVDEEMTFGEYKLIVIKDKAKPTETRPMEQGYVDHEGWPFICRIKDVNKIKAVIKRVQVSIGPETEVAATAGK